MTTTQDADAPSPWISIWLSPRRTIDHVLGTRPRRFVWLLAGLGTIAGFYFQFLGLGYLDQLSGWRLWLGFAVVSAIIGIVFLYLNALILHWMGRLIGGRASTLELRAVLAWSAVPTILGSIIALSFNAMVTVFDGARAVSPMVRSLSLLAIVVLFGFWSFIIVLLMLSRVQRFGFWRTIMAYSGVLIFPFLIAILVRTFLFQPFNLPSHSMDPTMLIGDYFFVSKYAYGYSRYSLPFSPRLFSGRILGSEPMRGDVVAFRLKDGVTDYVKRVVGLPGDRIQMRQGVLYINDTTVQRERLDDFIDNDACGEQSAVSVKRWRETLPNGVSYETLDCFEHGFYDDTGIYTVPPDHFFMLGDNRDNSLDSRALSAMGYIPLENITGRVALIFLSRVPGANGSAPGVRRERFGLTIR